jgi:hypothetical protein
MGEELEKLAVASALLLAAKEMGLEMRHHLPVEEVARIYNGVGPEWMGKELRAKADRLSKTLLPAVMIHDVDYEYGTGTVQKIEAGPRDYKVTVQFDDFGRKIMYAAFAKLRKC